MVRKVVLWLILSVLIWAACSGSACLALDSARASSAAVPAIAPLMPRTGEAGPLDYLKKAQDRFHTATYVYQDFVSAGNHFPARARMSSSGDEEKVLQMKENWMTGPFEGKSCIRCGFTADGMNWGGWYFMTGVLNEGATGPSDNWGDYPGTGVDLRGATKLTFRAKGEKGGETVEFFCGGIGRNPFSGLATNSYPDSLKKASTGFVKLSKKWQTYTIDLKGRDLKAVLGGFGWVTNAVVNKKGNVIFYIDDISYDKQRLNEPRLITSYEIPASAGTDVLNNTAFTYDNAVALLGFLAAGEKGRARLIADALVYAQQNDRFYNDGRIRNAYQAGDLKTPPGWVVNGKKNTVRISGWYDNKLERWLEDEFQVSTHTGNVAWTMLALTGYYQACGGEAYLKSALRMGEWVEKNCRDERGAGGYIGGYSGFESGQQKLNYKSTEHNIDLYAAFMKLYALTKDGVWLERAEYAKRFIESMWDSAEGKFWTGTENDGITANKGNIPLDIQTWALLSLKDEGKKYAKSLDYMEKNHKAGGGYDFNQDRDGIWYEGTAQAAETFHFMGNEAKYAELLTVLGKGRSVSGGIPAAGKDGLTTGFYLNDGQPWLYYKWIHTGATAWVLLAEKGFNPFN